MSPNYYQLSIPSALWEHMRRAGFVASTIKGNPYTTHARRRDSNKAICGKKPGTSHGTWKMKDRTGWRFFLDGRGPNCEACGKASAKFRYRAELPENF